MTLRTIGFVLVLTTAFWAVLGCAKETEKEYEKGVRLGLETLVEGLNQRDMQLYTTAFSGAAETIIKDSVSKEMFDQIEGIFFLEEVSIEELLDESGPKTPVGVAYHLRHEFPSGEVRKQRHRVIFAPSDKHEHWVIISILAD